MRTMPDSPAEREVVLVAKIPMKSSIEFERLFPFLESYRQLRGNRLRFRNPKRKKKVQQH
jgi:hypothetical protein